MRVLAMGLPNGENVAEYEVTGILGEGGFGTVYSGIHPLIGKKVAIKVLKSAVAGDKDTVARFLQEARAVNQIGHPNIIDIFAFGEVDSGQHYFIMEWLPGQSLQERLKEDTNLSLHESAHILVEIAKGLEAAHEKGIYHRDLKPANIYLIPSREGLPRVKILDFGIAKLTDGAGVNTHSGVAIGSPRYMSPEQWDGHNVDERTDVYALGILLFQMLTGDVPFRGSTSLKLMAQHVTVTPPAASSKGAPECIDSVITHALQKEALHRTPSAAAFRQELTQAIEGLSSALLHQRAVDSEEFAKEADSNAQATVASPRHRLNQATEATAPTVSMLATPSTGGSDGESARNGTGETARHGGVERVAGPVAEVERVVADEHQTAAGESLAPTVARRGITTGTVALVAALVVSTAVATYLYAREGSPPAISENSSKENSFATTVVTLKDAAVFDAPSVSDATSDAASGSLDTKPTHDVFDAGVAVVDGPVHKPSSRPVPAAAKADIETANRALKANNYLGAGAAARRSLKVAHTSEAYAIIVKAYCGSGKGQAAQGYLSKVRKKQRGAVRRYCKSLHNIELE